MDHFVFYHSFNIFKFEFYYKEELSFLLPFIYLAIQLFSFICIDS